jgi:hypothetical protein
MADRDKHNQEPDQGPHESPAIADRAPLPLFPDRRSPENLHICPDCESSLVYPLDWAPVDKSHWRVELRCPECRWQRAGLYEQSVLDRFDAILDSGTDSLVDDLCRLQRSNMEGELESFVRALEVDLILPEDF